MLLWHARTDPGHATIVTQVMRTGFTAGLRWECSVREYPACPELERQLRV